VFFSEQHHEEQRHRGARKTEPNQVESTDLSELLIPLFTIIIVHNTVTQRQFFFSIPLPPDQHNISDVDGQMEVMGEGVSFSEFLP